MSSSLVELLGEKLLSSSGELATNDALAGKAAVALYFSAHWCPPCQGFTPQLSHWYKDALKAKGLEVVFVSSDKNEASFKDYFAEMPWMALPFEKRQLKDMLSKKFKVRGIPTVVILDSNGNVITTDGREAIGADPTGEEFPWKPKSLKEILSGATLISSEGPVKSSALDDKVFGLYFSAHWCPPCRGFTPKLAEWYNKDLKQKGLEIVFVSSDRDEESFNEYFKDQPWLALDYSNRQGKEQLSKLFGVSGIPSLVIIDRDGSTITKDGQTAVSSDPEGAEFPWHPKPVHDLANGPGSLNETAVVVALCEALDGKMQQLVQDAMEPLARQFLDDAKVAGDDEPKVSFMIAKSSDGISSQLRKLMSLEGLPPAKHCHPLEVAKANGGRWGCDGCNQPGSALGASKRFRCTMGCDFDYCEECNRKAGSEGSAPCRLMLINIPDDGAFYEGPKGEFTSDAVQKFVSSFLSGTAERKQLQR